MKQKKSVCSAPTSRETDISIAVLGPCTQTNGNNRKRARTRNLTDALHKMILDNEYIESKFEQESRTVMILTKLKTT